MRSFTHIEPDTINEAYVTLENYNGRAQLIAGGTDLLLTLKADYLPEYPEAVINIKRISDLDTIEEKGDTLRLGALAKLSDIAKSPLLLKKYKVLSEAAHSVATPQIRNTATLGGNLCQDVRCWYYRYPRHLGGPIQCLRKGKGACLAVKGDNRYHAIFGGKKCFAVCPSDTAVALAALDARITVTGPNGERKIPVPDFFGPLKNALDRDEIVTEFEVPATRDQTQQNFLKFTLRKPVDFAIVSIASVIDVEDGLCRDARIVLGAVAPGPVRAKEAEDFLKGKPLDQKSVEDATELVVAGAKPLSGNAYKIEILKSLLKRSILACSY